VKYDYRIRYSTTACIPISLTVVCRKQIEKDEELRRYVENKRTGVVSILSVLVHSFKNSPPERGSSSMYSGLPDIDQQVVGGRLADGRLAGGRSAGGR